MLHNPGVQIPDDEYLAFDADLEAGSIQSESYDRRAADTEVFAGLLCFIAWGCRHCETGLVLE